MTQLRIIFLGTGGSWPTVKRNVSSIAVKRGSEIILFDCGEGTQRQFQQSNLSYMQISKIFITHFHGDHFLGIPGLIQTMQLNDRDKPLHIYGPKGMVELTNQLLTLGYFRPSYRVIAHEVTDGEEIKFDGYSISALKVSHNVPALAYSVKEYQRAGKFNKSKALKMGIPEGPLFSKLQKGQTIILPNGEKVTPDLILGPSRKGRKIVISGDTKPSNQIIGFSEDADVLIHEATFDSRLQEIAKEYGHTTAVQAAEIAKKAGVEKLFLVHISPRYLDYHVLEDEARSVFPHSYAPKDFQEVEVKLKK
ncbi:MAG TPA: ribonuclease Z [Candidatus Thermoplasmatota archaeon]|nr:ribonuclease Z [Candidatus Thermoplasmatota archaeon]